MVPAASPSWVPTPRTMSDTLLPEELLSHAGWGKIPSQAPFNGEFTHPLVVANLTGALLEAAGMPLSEAQAAAIARLGEDYERQYDQKQAEYGADTPALKK